MARFRPIRPGSAQCVLETAVKGEGGFCTMKMFVPWPEGVPVSIPGGPRTMGQSALAFSVCGTDKGERMFLWSMTLSVSSPARAKRLYGVVPARVLRRQLSRGVIDCTKGPWGLRQRGTGLNRQCYFASLVFGSTRNKP